RIEAAVGGDPAPGGARCGQPHRPRTGIHVGRRAERRKRTGEAGGRRGAEGQGAPQGQGRMTRHRSEAKLIGGGAQMTTVVLGAVVVGTATAWYLSKSGHDVVLVERQAEAAMETSWGNGGIIHASEVEPWSQPGMPMKIIKWLGQENAPMLLRYG